MNIFLLEDDEAIGVALTYSLQSEGYSVTLAKSVAEAQRIINSDTFSLYILDLTLPDGSGYDICKAVKAQGDYPVIFLTAYDDEVNVVMGFDLGADDYITKPCSLEELSLRIKIHISKYKGISDQAGVLEFPPLKMNTDGTMIRPATIAINVSKKPI